MRAQTMVIGLLQAALLMACERPKTISEEIGKSGNAAYDKADNPVALGAVGQRTTSPKEVSAGSPPADQWFRPTAFDPASRLIIRTGQASIEVDSLESSMAELRRIVQRVGGFVADASVQSGRNQVRSATLELKVPAGAFRRADRRAPAARSAAVRQRRRGGCERGVCGPDRAGRQRAAGWRKG